MCSDTKSKSLALLKHTKKSKVPYFKDIVEKKCLSFWWRTLSHIKMSHFSMKLKFQTPLILVELPENSLYDWLHSMTSVILLNVKNCKGFDKVTHCVALEQSDMLLRY